MIFQAGRSIGRLPQLKALRLGNRRPLLTTSNLERVPFLYNLFASGNDAQNVWDSYVSTSVSHRTYATRPVSRPKAHTGRTTASSRKVPTTSATKAAKKPAPKKTSPKTAPKAKSKAKPKTKPKPKPKKTAKAKPKSKKKRKVPTEKQKLLKDKAEKAGKLKKLKEAALSPPTSTPASAWAVLLQEVQQSMKGDTTATVTSASKDASAKFKVLEPERLEACQSASTVETFANHTAALQSPCQSEQVNKREGLSPIHRVIYPNSNPQCQSCPSRSTANHQSAPGCQKSCTVVDSVEG